MLDDTPEPPINPPDPEPERGHWYYGEWIDDDGPEYDPELERSKRTRPLHDADSASRYESTSQGVSGTTGRNES